MLRWRGGAGTAIGDRLTGAQKLELWSRWKRGETMVEIGRALWRTTPNIHMILKAHGGIAPVERKRRAGSLSPEEREAIERGVSEQRIAKALDVDVPFLRAKIRLLKGICPEVADLLKDKHISMNAMSFLRRMAPLRQIEAAELMVAMNKFTANYAQSLLAATPRNSTASLRRQRHAALSPTPI